MIDDLGRYLPDYLLRQRWFAGDTIDKLEIVSRECFKDGWPRLEWMLVDVDGALYQLLLGGRPLGEHAGFLQGHEDAVVGEAESGFWYDATLDPELSLVFLTVITDGEEKADRVRPIGVEQSNTSLVYDDRLICKVFRRVHEGANLDVEVTTALSAAGFAHVAEPLVTWRRDGNDLAFGQQFLAGGAEGWALALTSIRDLFAGGPDDPAEAGGDFGSEARRLGRMTAEMHLALADAFGTSAADPVGWAGSMQEHLTALADDERVGGEKLIDRLADLADAGAAIRVHGDYHLGQVMRTDAGWFVLDFEGEPARSLAERRQPSSPMKDVTGMLRSIDYATRSVLAERDRSETERVEPLAGAWNRHNREAFLDGYFAAPGIGALLPSDPAAINTVLAAFELDKAVYELRYELAYRPTWVDIPRTAIRRLTNGGNG